MLYRGGPEYFYRLRVRDGPKVDFVAATGRRPTRSASSRSSAATSPAAAPAGMGVPFERLATRFHECG